MKKTFIPLFVGLLCWTGTHAKIIQVSVGEDLQAAIDDASPNDVIKVQDGTFTGKFFMREGVNVIGGYSDFSAEPTGLTTLDGNKSGRVLTQDKNFATWTEWSNFTITNGSVSGNGGGVQLCKKGRIKNCTVTGNTATGNGGGVFNDAVDAATDVLIDNCTISSNKSTEGNGGGLYIRGTIQFSTIQSNKTTGSGKPAGGAQLQGGRMVNCKVISNEASGDAGGVRAYNKCDVINNLICNNTASNAIGGLSIEGALSNVIGNTIVSNNQLTETGPQAGVKVNNSLNSNSTFFVNNIVWDNRSNGTVENQQVYCISRYDKSAGQRSYNAILGQLGDDSAETSIQLTAADPGFADKDHIDYDYSLSYTSSLRNAGSNNFYTEGDKDLKGYERKIDGTVDIGAYECQFIAGDRTVGVGEDLQYVVNFTLPGQTVKVQEGTFTGNFVMINNVKVIGGYSDFSAEPTGLTTLDANHSGRVLTQHVCFDTETTWSNFILQNGNASNDGGGAQLHHNGVLSNCIITNNTTSGNAGGVVMERGGKVLNSKIVSNKAELDDGGVRMTGKDYSGTLANCLVANNKAVQKTGGISLETREQYVYSNTIVNNNQTSMDNASCCGVRLHVEAPLEFANNIIWGNTANDEAQADQIELNSNYVNNQASHFNNNAIVLSTEFATETTKTLYLTEDPFIDAANGNYYLNIATAADLINSGESSKAQGSTDLAGNRRKQGDIDRGCYEQTMYKRTENVADGNYGTICLPFAVKAGSFIGAKVYKVLSFADASKVGIVLEEVEDMEAGKPYFFLGEAPEVKFRYVRAGGEADAGHENGLYGTISETKELDAGGNYYVLQANELRPVASSITVDKNKAYLDLDEVPNAPAVTPTPSPRRRVIGVYQVPTGMDQISHDQYTNKVLRNGQLLILRDGRTYNALGMEVK